MSAKKTVLLVHTNQHAQHLGPVDVRREHNARCNTNCKTSLANMPLSRKTTSTRKLLLPPLFPLPLRRLWVEADRLPPCSVLRRAERLAAPDTASELQHLLLVLLLLRLLLQHSPPLLLLLLLLLLKLSLEEALDHAVGTTKRRHREERSPSSHVTDRGWTQRLGQAASREAGSSVPVGRSTSPSLPPLWPWWLSSGSVERRSAARCGASQQPGPQRSTAARVATTSAVVAACDAEQLPTAACWPSLQSLHKKKR